MNRGSSDASDPPTVGGGDTRPLVLAGIRITHERAPIDVLEVASHNDPADRLHELLAREGVSEATVLQTCNRVEEYVVAETPRAGRRVLSDAMADIPDDAIVEMDHGESLRHLLAVAAGLDSQVLGEDQILGQVREAYKAAEDAGGLGPVLEDALLKAIHVGERARNETAINEGIVSLGSAAVDLADGEGLLDGRVLVVGAGEVAETVVSALADRDVGDLHVLNRSPERAAALAEGASAEHAGLDDLEEHLAAADVAIVSTGSDAPVVDADALSEAGRTLLVDLGQPRDVTPTADDLPGVSLHDLDDLRAVTRRTHEERREAAAEVREIVEAEYEHLVESYKRKRADAVISGMYRGAERIKERELARALAELDDLDDEEREVVRNLADAIVSHLLSVPTESLRDAAANDDLETLMTAIELFDPSAEGEDVADVFADLPPSLIGAAVPGEAPVGEGSEE